MALIILGHTRCSICNRTVGSGDTYFSTWGIFLPDHDRLCAHCDASMHWDCYANWKDRPRFARAYFDFWANNHGFYPTWSQIHRDDRVFATLNTDLHGGIGEVHLVLSETGSRLSIRLDEWERWIGGEGWRPAHPLEERAIAEAIPVLSRTIPDREAIFAIYRRDEAEIERAKAKLERERVERDEVRSREISAHNQACWHLWLEIRHAGWACRKCGKSGVHDRDFRLSERSGSKSMIICRACGEVYP